MRVIDLVRKLCPSAKPVYLQAFANGDQHFIEHGLTSNARIMHFLAQAMHESGGFSLLRESGNYREEQILKIFGVGKHSAAVKPSEAEKLAGNGPALFERVYGLGNPRKAAELGNTRPGDGWAYRGNGILQTTGRGNHRRMSVKCGLGSLFEDSPEAVTSAEYALLPALTEWRESGCNTLADKGDILAITKRINGGTNGLDDRKAWLAKIQKVVGNQSITLEPVRDAPATPPLDYPVAPADPAKPNTKPSPAVVGGAIAVAAAAGGGLWAWLSSLPCNLFSIFCGG